MTVGLRIHTADYTSLVDPAFFCQKHSSSCNIVLHLKKNISFWNKRLHCSSLPVGHHLDYRRHSIDEECLSPTPRNWLVQEGRERGDSHPAGSAHSQQREGEAHPPIDLRAPSGNLATLRVRFWRWRIKTSSKLWFTDSLELHWKTQSAEEGPGIKGRKLLLRFHQIIKGKCLTYLY